MTDYKDHYEYKILTNDTVKLTTAIEGISIGTEGVVTKIVEPGISYFVAFPTIEKEVLHTAIAPIDPHRYTHVTYREINGDRYIVESCSSESATQSVKDILERMILRDAERDFRENRRV